MSYVQGDPRATDRRDAARASTTSASHALDPRLVRYLERLSSGGFFGKIVVSFQNGKAVDVRIEQTKKLEDL